MIKPRRITGLDLNQAFTIGDVQPVSKIEDMEQTEIQTFVEELKTIEVVEKNSNPDKSPPKMEAVKKKRDYEIKQKNDQQEIA